MKWISLAEWLALLHGVTDREWLALLELGDSRGMARFRAPGSLSGPWYSLLAWLARLKWMALRKWLAQSIWVAPLFWLAHFCGWSPDSGLARMVWVSCATWLASRHMGCSMDKARSPIEGFSRVMARSRFQRLTLVSRLALSNGLSVRYMARSWMHGILPWLGSLMINRDSSITWLAPSIRVYLSTLARFSVLGVSRVAARSPGTGCLPFYGSLKELGWLL